MTPQSRSLPISGRSASSLLFLLSGEQTGLPEAEARSLVLMLDPRAAFSRPERRVLIAETTADPSAIESRVAFSRRVGAFVPNGELTESHLANLRQGSYAVRVLRTVPEKRDSDALVTRLAGQVGGRVSLRDPDCELTVIKGEKEYIGVTFPKRMKQSWVVRRPRARAFFHPAAIFPKLSRLLVNLSRVREEELFLDPFCGTGSLLIEAFEIGALPVGSDLSTRMTKGAVKNRDRFGEEWLGVLRADVKRMPVRRADAIATDIPYGRASSTSGSSAREVLEALMTAALELLPREKRLVVMHPKTVEVGTRDGFEVEEEHHLYIHRTLTRTISVLRRV